MVNWRRAHVPGGSFFFTVVTNGRLPLFQSEQARSLLGAVFRRCLLQMPFTLDAMVLLPDHLHAIWTLPPGDTAYSARWGWIKKEFSNEWLPASGNERDVSSGRRKERRHGIWQPRFWEHTLQNEHDFDCHFDYVHYNPVKHGHAACPADWSASTFHRWVERGVYERDWGCSNLPAPDFEDLSETVGELD